VLPASQSGNRYQVSHVEKKNTADSGGGDVFGAKVCRETIGCVWLVRSMEHLL
jgi:hypothetical protein